MIVYLVGRTVVKWKVLFFFLLGNHFLEPDDIADTLCKNRKRFVWSKNKRDIITFQSKREYVRACRNLTRVLRCFAPDWNSIFHSNCRFWQPSAVYRWLPMIHPSPTDGSLRLSMQLLYCKLWQKSWYKLVIVLLTVQHLPLRYQPLYLVCFEWIILAL